MSEVKKILESGILESYCLGQISPEEESLVSKYLTEFPELNEEINAIRQSIETYATSFAIEPPEELKSTILSEIDKLIESGKTPPRLEAFKAINHNSDIKDWQRIVKGIEPPDKYEIHLHDIYSDKDNILFVAWVKNEVPPEIHEDLYESFFILEGNCTCKVGEEYVHLKAGEYFDIPLFVEHSIKVTSDIPVKAILQRKLSA